MIIPKVNKDDMNVIIGTRHWIGPEWIHIDADKTPLIDDNGKHHAVDIVCDARKLDLEDQCAQFVFNSECLEHFPWAETEDVLNEWCRIVAPGGTIRVEVPDFLLACKEVLAIDTLEKDLAVRQIFYGGQINEFDFHYTGITPRMFEFWFSKIGFDIVNLERGNECGWLRVDAVRPK